MSRSYGNSGGHKFSQTPQATIQRSTFDRSHGHKTSFDGGFLVPIMVDEVLPGDTFNCRAHIFVRQATPYQPLLDNMRLTSFSFFCPTRLVWTDHHKFMGAQDDPGDATNTFIVPQVVMNATEITKQGSLFDHMGIPPAAGAKSINALPSRCSNLIWNEWFRAQDLQNSLVVDKDAGPDSEVDYRPLRKRGKRHDYFSAAQPFTQKGDVVPLIIGGTVPVTGTIDAAQIFTIDANGDPTFSVNSVSGRFLGQQSGATAAHFTGAGSSDSTATWDNPALDVDISTAALSGTADLTTATANTINELRMAFQIQKLYERDSRGGTRYTEIIRSHFGISSPDSRLQRPEFLGGGTQTINTTPVPVSSDAASGIVGELGAYATSTGSNHSWAKSFTEHGYVITYVSVQADLTYGTGISRLWTRSTKHDFYWPALAGIGEQAIRNDELFADNSANDILTWGYTPRYDEYRHFPSQLSNLMRSEASGSLDIWHLAIDFGGTLPVLGASYIEDNPPIDRVSAITNEDNFILDVHFDYKCTRPMPTFGVPGMIDHF